MGSFYARTCADCGRTISYSERQKYREAEAAARPCRSCGALRRVADVAKKVIEGRSAGLTNREIAAVAGCHHATVAKHLRRAGLSGIVRPAGFVDNDHRQCGECGKVLANDQFALVRSRVDARRLSICRPCRSRRAREGRLSTPEVYFREREKRIFNGQRRASRSHISVDLPEGYLLGLWRYQDGRCFYTDRMMTIAPGADASAIPSVDRVDSRDGYLVGNVVLCANRVNTIKQDMTLDEMRDWTPDWYRRVVECLPILITAVIPIPDVRPRGRSGRILPPHAIERRERIARFQAVGL